MISSVAIDRSTWIIHGFLTESKIMHSVKRITSMALAGKVKTPGKNKTPPHYLILKGFREK
jgi:hypothetical protein